MSRNYSISANVPHSHFKLRQRLLTDVPFGLIVPTYAEMVLPSGTYRANANYFMRMNPQLAPNLTQINCTTRYFFVPLRLIEAQAEEILTGSKDGHYVAGTPESFFPDIVDGVQTGKAIAKKHSIFEYLIKGPLINYENTKGEAFMPAKYWFKAYARSIWDYYRDENLSNFSDTDDFEIWFNKIQKEGAFFDDPKNHTYFWSNLPRDYFTAALPFQQKGDAPVIPINLAGARTVYDIDNFIQPGGSGTKGLGVTTSNRIAIDPASGTGAATPQNALAAFNNNSVQAPNASFTITQFRLASQLQKVYEQLARTGSRYVEWLNGFYGCAPADGTLQRAQLVSWFSQPIIQDPVTQTGTDGNTAIGTLRGKGISDKINFTKPLMFKEPGVLLGLTTIMPKTMYTQGINRKYSIKGRWDLPNPYFQNLSEQGVRNGEIYVDETDKHNDDIFGFVPNYEDFRTDTIKVTGELRGELSYWVQSLNFKSRPNLNGDFISSHSYIDSWMAPFAVKDRYPFVCDFNTVTDEWLPLSKYSIPR